MLWRLHHHWQRRRRRRWVWKESGGTRARSVARVTYRRAACSHIWDITRERGRTPATSVGRHSFSQDICRHTCVCIPASDVTPAASVENGLELPVTWRYGHRELKTNLFLFFGDKFYVFIYFIYGLLCTEVVHSHKHTYMSSSYSSLDWVLSHWANFTYLCLSVCILCVCFICVVLLWAWWGGPDGIGAFEA